ncbi:MAG: alpha/beta hydrolase [Pseudomonadales bacterium]|nr:alpha/beta hydrolase [Pseudomonadales bacterium]
MARWDREPSKPSIPDWFFTAVETPSEERRVEVDDCDVVYQRWDAPAGARPVLLIHGMNAHSHWWDFIAPQLAPEYRCAAMNLTGMGDSDYRYEYTGTTYAEEIRAVCDHAGFGNDVVVVAHSFGGYMAVKAANLFPERFGGLILVDSGIRHPDEPVPERPQMGGRAKTYPDRETALARFRLQPPQSCENTYILEYIARHSLVPVDGGGWAWKFDEDLPDSLKDVMRTADEYRSLRLPLGLIYGADSALFSARTVEYMRELIPQDFPAVAIDDAQHHVFLDQPLAFVAALRDMLGRIGR